MNFHRPTNKVCARANWQGFEPQPQAPTIPFALLNARARQPHVVLASQGHRLTD